MGDGRSVRVRETPSARNIEGVAVITRRFEIDPTTNYLHYLASAEPGTFAKEFSGVLVERPEDCLLVESSGLLLLPTTRTQRDHPQRSTGQPAPAGRGVTTITRPTVVDYAFTSIAEKDGRGPYSARRTNHVHGTEARIWLGIPPHASVAVLEVDTAVAANPTLAKNVRAGLVQARLAAAANRPTYLPSRWPTILSADASFVDKPAGDEAFTVEHFPIPKDLKLMVGGMDFLPNGDLAVCTYAGEVWIVAGATSAPAQARWRRFARGLNESGGLRVIHGQIYVTQKGELTRLTDTDGNGEADFFECLSDGWGYTGNYHSFATGPAFDARGNLYVMITGHRTIYDVPLMGWCVRVKPEITAAPSQVQNLSARGTPLSTRYQTEPFCSGLRVPNGFGEFNGELFMTDNQGHWIAANKLNHLQPGRFYGHPSAQPAPSAQFEGDSNFAPPAVWFPYAWIRSVSGIATITNDQFGLFQGQMLVGEFQNASVFRVALEQVNGEWQGAVFPFVKGFASGVNRLAFGPDGKLYVGGLRLGHWTSIAPQPYSLDRVSFTGQMPFEIKEVHARANGFELKFTQPVDAASAGNLENWDAAQYTYAYDGRHNAPEKDRDEKIPGPPLRVTKAVVASDRRSVRLHAEGCLPRHVIMVRALDVKNADGKKLRNDTFHYTLNQVPKN